MVSEHRDGHAERVSSHAPHPLSDRPGLASPRRWISMACAMWSTHELTAATGLLQRDVHVRAGPCGREVGPPVLMGDSYARPCAFGPSERTGIGSTSRKDCLRSNPKFEQ